MPRIQDHLRKLSWIAADRFLLVGYGLVALLQIRALSPSEYGLYALLVSIQTWIFVVADGLVLQSIVQFGAERSQRPVLDGTIAVLYAAAIACIVCCIILSEPVLSLLFGEPRFANVVALEAILCVATVPRTYCLRLLQRDVQTRQMFWIDAAWVGSMSVATAHGITTGWLRDFESLATVAIGGIALSSITALWLCRGILRFAKPSSSMMKRLVTFGLQQMSAGAIHTSIRQLDVTVAQAFFGTAAVGTYQAAKTIFRLFEVALDAAGSVVYPAVVSFHHTGDRDALYAVVSKAISAMFVVSCAMSIGIWVGGDIIGTVLGERYAAAVGQLRILAVAGVLMPFMLSSIVLVASGRSVLHTAMVVCGALVGVMCFIACGVVGQTGLFPLGVVAYYATVSTGDWWTLRRTGVLRLSGADLFRSIPDALSFLKRWSK
ncbi:MAG: oligosaccharide flippase family protein [Chlorobi bacterium]|nr:oligosaccharide flippase family protein [Chlorobiota bacterium]